MSGQIIYRIKNPSKKADRQESRIKEKHTRVIIIFADGSRLFFNDIRKFGWMKVILKIKNKILKTQIKNQKTIDDILGLRLGVEPFSKEFTVEYLKTILSKTTRPIKLVLMDQEKIAGIGNIYANEILFEAGILPVRPAKKLSPDAPTVASGVEDPDRSVGKIKIASDAIKKLREAIIEVLRRAIKYKGTSVSNYIQPSGELGQYQEHFLVYQQEGKECKRCGRMIKRIKLGGRSSFYCPVCQS